MRIVEMPRDRTPDRLIKPKRHLHALVCKVDRLLRQMAEYDQRYEQLLQLPIMAVRRYTQPVRMGREYKSCRWHDQTFYFTNEQAPVVGMLYQAFVNGTPRVHEKTLIARLKPDADELGQKVRMLHTFRSAKAMHPAMGYMIHVEDGWWWLGAPVPKVVSMPRAHRQTGS